MQTVHSGVGQICAFCVPSVAILQGKVTGLQITWICDFRDSWMALRGLQNLGHWRHVMSVYQEGGREKQLCEGQGFKEETATFGHFKI